MRLLNENQCELVKPNKPLVVFLDLRKAFGTANRVYFLQKLERNLNCVELNVLHTHWWWHSYLIKHNMSISDIMSLRSNQLTLEFFKVLIWDHSCSWIIKRFAWLLPRFPGHSFYWWWCADLENEWSRGTQGLPKIESIIAEWKQNKTAGKHRHIFRPTTNILFANGWKQNYCFDISFQRVFTNINSTTDLCTLCKRVSRFSVENFLSHSTKKLRRETLRCFRKFLISKKFRLQRVMSRFSVENFLSHSTETFRRGTL